MATDGFLPGLAYPEQMQELADSLARALNAVNIPCKFKSVLFDVVCVTMGRVDLVANCRQCPGQENKSLPLLGRRLMGSVPLVSSWCPSRLHRQCPYSAVIVVKGRANP
jgi:hypothetical protein